MAAGPDLAAIAPGVAYFTADHPNAGSMFDGFEVLEVMPYRIKPLRQWLAARGIVRLEVKKRGVPLDPEIVRRELLTAKRGDKQVAEKKRNYFDFGARRWPGHRDFDETHAWLIAAVHAVWRFTSSQFLWMRFWAW